jgi:hypothetical protein
VYGATAPLSVVVESLAPFRASGALRESMLTRAGLPLALAEIELDGAVVTLDLDDPELLVRESLRPSLVATRKRSTTQRIAAELFERHPEVGALRWWSTLEASWENVTVFDRAEAQLALVGCAELHVDDPVVAEAAAFLGLLPPHRASS